MFDAYNTTTGLPAYAVNTVTYVLLFLPFLALVQEVTTAVLGDEVVQADLTVRLTLRGQTFDNAAGIVLFAEATSCQLEFKYLAKLTGRKEYYHRVRSSVFFVPFFLQSPPPPPSSSPSP